ncbi:MAG: CinA family protein [Hyphomicrobiaceae bacterium]
MFSEDLVSRAARLEASAREQRLKIATAESCTGGLIAGLLTEVPGSSDVVERGFVTYSNEAKIELLGVPAEVIAAVGAVSRETALAMAQGAIGHSHADIAVAVTGVAGPGGGSAEKPVGLVHLALHRRGGETVHREMRYGDLGRGGIRLATVTTAIDMLEQALAQRG